LKSEKKRKLRIPEHCRGGTLVWGASVWGRMSYQVWVGQPVLDRYWTVGLQLIYSTGPVRSTRRWTVRSLAMGSHVPYMITQRYLPPAEVTFSPFPPAN